MQESMNFQLRKIIKNRGHFPDDDAAMKLLYLGIRNITGRHVDGTELVLERGERGTGSYGWKSRPQRPGRPLRGPAIHLTRTHSQ